MQMTDIVLRRLTKPGRHTDAQCLSTTAKENDT